MSERPAMTPVFIGIGFTIVFLAGLAYVTNRRRAQEPESVPSLSIVSPAADAVVDSPLVIRFTSERPLVLKPSGWGVGRLHIHATVNGMQYMPAAGDIQAVDSAIFTWTLRAVQRGPLRFQLGWADAAHRELSKGQTTESAATIR